VLEATLGFLVQRTVVVALPVLEDMYQLVIGTGVYFFVPSLL
jgi:hypothetical protein